MGHRSEQRQAVGRDGRHLQLQRQVRNHGGQVSVARPLAVAVDTSLDMGGTDRHAGQRVGHRTSAVVVEVDADLGLEPAEHVPYDPVHLVGQRAAVGVAQHQGLGSCFFCRLQDPHGEFGVGLVAVKEVLGIQEDPEIVRSQEGDRVGHHGDGLVEGGPQRVDHVHLRRLGHDADGFGLRVDHVAQRLVVLGPHTGTPGRAERHQRGAGQVEFGGGAPEEFGILGVGPGPATFDEGDAEFVQLLGHAQLVIDRQRQPLLLGTITQCRVEDVHRIRQVGQVEVVASDSRLLVVVVVFVVAAASAATAVVSLLAEGQRVGVLRPAAVAVGMAVTVGLAIPFLGRRVGLVVEGGPVTRHSPTSPGTDRPCRGPHRSRSPGSAW